MLNIGKYQIDIAKSHHEVANDWPISVKIMKNVKTQN